jgi:hypothetical protein
MAEQTLREKVLEQITKRTAESRLVKLTMPEWGVDVYIARLDVAEKLDLEVRIGSLDQMPKHEQAAWRARYVAEVALDAHGKRIFSPEDVPTLQRDYSTAVERIVLAQLSINTVTREDLKDLGKGSAPVPNGASPSA